MERDVFDKIKLKRSFVKNLETGVTFYVHDKTL